MFWSIACPRLIPSTPRSANLPGPSLLTGSRYAIALHPNVLIFDTSFFSPYAARKGVVSILDLYVTLLALAAAINM